ncbi:phosphate propanoyltransferase [Desulfosporosinus sp. OT]|uniref:phosphate propanoyltransferase n=1 Tax=Desulfosporosinus sp. OT TaxID=913865 RepID=UPI0002239DB4|nr:phosphate propanoyltransferase [Desulfosporosinus sp. OT]EGW35905.1 propanediol utilization PduL family protein [Desulfosporosinus sp. OT]
MVRTMMDRTMIEQIVTQVLTLGSNPEAAGEEILGIPVGISNRHIHLSAYHVEVLFGKGHTLTPKKELKQVGEFAAAETVTLIGPKGVIQGVRVLGPARKITQVEISHTDGFSLGILPPLRDSGQIVGSAGLIVVGTAGAITLSEGVICAARHIHMSNVDAQRFGVSDGDRVTAEVDGPRGCLFKNVLVRVHPSFCLEFHIDTDEANAVGLKNGDQVRLPQGEGV